MHMSGKRKRQNCYKPSNSRSEKNRVSLKEIANIKAELNRRENKEILELISKTKTDLGGRIHTHKGNINLQKTDQGKKEKILAINIRNKEVI